MRRARTSPPALLADPLPEVGLVRARQRRRHQIVTRDSAEKRPVLRDIQRHRDPPCFQDLGHCIQLALGKALPVVLAAA